jgi:hypothetical protein
MALLSQRIGLQLDDLLGVAITTPAAGDLLTFDGADWVDATPTAITDANSAITTAAAVGALDPATETSQKLWNERSAEFGYLGAWTTLKAYRVGNVVKQDNKTFYCLTAHTAAASFDTDNAAGYWSMIGNGGLANKVTTTDATVTTISSQTVPSNVAYSVIVRISAFEPATGDSKAWALEYHIKNVAGTCTANKISERAYEDAGASAWVAVVDVSGTTIESG